VIAGVGQKPEKTAIVQNALLPEENSSAPVRHLGLDAIRGLAILLVIFHHVGLRFPDSVHDSFSRFIVSIGWGGVDIFFAISGYLKNIF